MPYPEKPGRRSGRRLDDAEGQNILVYASYLSAESRRPCPGQKP